MNCNTALPVFSIYQGDAKTMNLAAAYANYGGPLDLTSCTEIVITLLNQDSTTTVLTLSNDDVSIQSPAVLGLFNAPISADVSALLNVGELQSFTVQFTIGSEIFTIPYTNCLSVLEES